MDMQVKDLVEPIQKELEVMKKQLQGRSFPWHSDFETWHVEDGGLAGAFGKPGTLVFHECNIMHGSPDNLASYPRTNLIFVYNSVKNGCKAPFSGQKPRPAFLASRDTQPLEALKEPLK